MARFTSFSSVPAGPTAPGSSPPCPGSSTTWRRAIGVPRTVASPPHGARATNVPSAFSRSTASTTPVGVTTARGGPPASSPQATAATVVVVVLGGAVVVVATWSSWRPWSWWSARPSAPPSSAASGSVRAPTTTRRSATSDQRDAQQHAEPRRHAGHDAMRRAAQGRAADGQRLLTTSTMSVPASVGFWPTCTPAACERLLLGGRRALAARHDGAGVAHLLAGRAR